LVDCSFGNVLSALRNAQSCYENCADENNDFYFWRTKIKVSNYSEGRIDALHVCGCALQGGVIIVGGNSKYEVPICLHTLAVRGQSIIGVRRGNRSQLNELVQLVANGQVSYLRVYVSLLDLFRVLELTVMCLFVGLLLIVVCYHHSTNIFGHSYNVAG
jgi:hypothetical protein